MKIRIMSLTLMGLLVCGLAEAQTDVTYLGEFCIDSYGFFEPVTVFKVGVLNYGDNHFALNGNWLNSNPSPVFGTAMIAGENIIATLTSSSVINDTDASYTVIYLAVNSTTMAGTMTTMTTSFLPTPSQLPAGQAPIYVYPCNP
jgi:hypothetical protein